MKKVLTILFLMLYVTLSVGVNILVHTCGGESQAKFVTTEVKDPCVCSDEMPMADMCCTTELKTVKIDDSQNVSISPVEETLSVIGEVTTFNIFTPDVEYFSFVIPNDISPPPAQDLQITNSVFLI